MDVQDRGRIFEFEKDFGQNLRCIPMAVRMKLDLSGIKLALKDWLRLGEDERQELLRFPCAPRAAAEAYRAKVQALVRARTGSEPELVSPALNPAWLESSPVPEDLITKAQQEGLTISPSQWAALGDLERFALIKLSRPHHENKNFVPAMKEFGLAIIGLR